MIAQANHRWPVFAIVVAAVIARPVEVAAGVVVRLPVRRPLLRTMFVPARLVAMRLLLARSLVVTRLRAGLGGCRPGRRGGVARGPRCCGCAMLAFYPSRRAFVSLPRWVSPVHSRRVMNFGTPGGIVM